MSSINFGLSDVIPIGSLVNSRFKGNFHDATILDVDIKLKCKVGYMKNDEYTMVSLDSRLIKGNVKVDEEVVCEIDGNNTIGTIKNIIDVSTYKLDFYDGDYGYAKRRQLLVKKLPELVKKEHFDLEITQHNDTVNNNLNGSRDDSSLRTPGKRNTFNSLLSSLDSMDPKESSMIMNVIEMSFNESKGGGRSRSQSSSKSLTTNNHNKYNSVQKDVIKVPNILPPIESLNDESTSKSLVGSDDESITELVHRKLKNSVLLECCTNISIDDLVEILHIELYSKINGVTITKYPSIKDEIVDIYQMFKSVMKLGGSEMVSENKKWREVANDLHLQSVVPATFCCLKRFFNRWLQPYIIHNKSNGQRKCCVCVSKINAYFEEILVPNSKQINLKQYRTENNNESNRTLSSKLNRYNAGKTVYKSAIGPLLLKNNIDDEKFDLKSDSDVTTSRNRKSKRANSLISSNEDIEKDRLFISDELNNDDYYYSESSFPDNNNTQQQHYSKKDEFVVYESVEDGEQSLKVGSFVSVKYGKSSSLDYYPAKIVAIRRSNNIYNYLVHYKGWNSRYDEWVKSKNILFDKKSSVNIAITASQFDENNHGETTPITQTKDPVEPLEKLTILSEPHPALLPLSQDIVIGKRRKGRPPTKHLLPSKDNPIKVVHDKKFVSSQTLNDDPRDGGKANSLRFSLTTSTTPSSHTITRTKNNHENKSESLLMSNFSGGRHRRTRNSLEDAILNAVIEQSVLESQGTTDQNKDHLDSNDHYSTQQNDANAIDEIMASIIGNSGEHNETDLAHRNKVVANQKPTQYSVKIGPNSNKTSAAIRGGRTKSNSTKVSPPPMMIPSNENDGVNRIRIKKEKSNPNVGNFNKYDGSYIDTKISYENNHSTNYSALYVTKKFNNDDINTPVQNDYIEPYENPGESNRKRLAEYNPINNTVETSDSNRTSSMSGKSSKHHISNTNKYTMNDISKSNDVIIPLNDQLHENINVIDKKCSRSTISFITKVNRLIDYFNKKYKSIDGELTSTASLDNIKIMETFIAEIQQSHSKLKQKLRKLERQRKAYLQKY